MTALDSFSFLLSWSDASQSDHIKTIITKLVTLSQNFFYSLYWVGRKEIRILNKLIIFNFIGGFIKFIEQTQ